MKAKHQRYNEARDAGRTDMLLVSQRLACSIGRGHGHGEVLNRSVSAGRVRGGRCLVVRPCSGAEAGNVDSQRSARPAAVGQEGDPFSLATERGEWWQYRGDRRLSGRSRRKGDTESPAVEWVHPIAGRETLLAARLPKGPQSVDLPMEDVAVSKEGRNWNQVLMDWRVAGRYRASWFDLDADGESTGTTVSYHHSYNQKI